jgi:nicotinate phosphoribosyltransferase
VNGNVPADKFAVGSSLLKNPIDFTADLVQPCVKVGRSEQPTDRLTEV